MAQAQVSPAFLLEENFEDFLDPAWVHIGPILSKRVFPTALPPPYSFGVTCELKCLMGWLGRGLRR